jgi:hypothetical protein
MLTQENGLKRVNAVWRRDFHAEARPLGEGKQASNEGTTLVPRFDILQQNFGVSTITNDYR